MMANKKSNPSICILGAGFSGICAAIQLQKQLGITNYKIFDENEDFGGTWLVNTYPGCACDVQSHLYSLSFELNPNWSENYSPGEEIWRYMQRTAAKYGLYQNAQFNTQIQSVEWIEEKNHWIIITYDKKSKKIQNNTYDFIISGVGGLRVPLIPQEFEAFTGPKMHSAVWNPKINLKNKKVGVIGSGASAIQIIPEIAPLVSELHSFQRKPAWVLPRIKFRFPQFVQKLFALLPFLMVIMRWLNFITNEIVHSAFLSNSFMNKRAGEMAYGYLKSQTKNNEKIRAELKPDFKFGCKRILVSSDYYRIFTKPNVQLHRSQISKIEKNSITTVDGKKQELDVLILATGFRVQEFCYPLKITGRNKINLQDDWKNGPSTYYGIMCHNLPNGFFLLGPNTALGHNSVLFMIEAQANFAIKVIKETIERGAKGVSVTKYAETKWMSDLEQEMKKTIWGNEECGSWYRNSEGKVTTLWPKNCTAYFRETRNVKLNDMEFTY